MLYQSLIVNNYNTWCYINLPQSTTTTHNVISISLSQQLQHMMLYQSLTVNNYNTWWYINLPQSTTTTHNVISISHSQQLQHMMLYINLSQSITTTHDISISQSTTTTHDGISISLSQQLQHMIYQSLSQQSSTIHQTPAMALSYGHWFEITVWVPIFGIKAGLRIILMSRYSLHGGSLSHHHSHGSLLWS